MSDLERLAQWMISESLSTGHGDDMDGLLEEMSAWVADVRAERDRYKRAPTVGSYTATVTFRVGLVSKSSAVPALR